MNVRPDFKIADPDVLIRHEGVPYVRFLSHAARVVEAERYLEIGTNTGRSLAAVACASIAIDPQFRLSFPVTEGKELCLLYRMTSDAYFRRFDPRDALGGPIDLAFLDGMHRFEFLLRDFMQVEKVMRRNGVIFLHDCLPPTFDMTSRRVITSSHPDFEGYWTGDVWKTAVILRRFRPDLRMTFLDCPPTGLVMITDLDPKSTVLDEGYSAIVEETARMADEEAELGAFIRATPVKSSDALMEEEELQLLIRP